MKKLLLFSLVGVLTLAPKVIMAQNVAITDDDGYTAESSAILDVKSDSKGLLFPRLTTAQRTTLASSAVEGLMVYDTQMDSFFYFDGTNWIPLYSNMSGLSIGFDKSLFSVVNSTGDTVFAVYPEGVFVNVGDGNSTKGNRGGFAVGGLSSGGKSDERYFRVFRDSVRVNINESVKANRGGFAVGGLSSKGSNDIMKITKDNYFIGHESGANINNGQYNNCLGYQSGAGLTDGNYNVFMGHEAGKNNTLGNHNVFIGYKAGLKNIGDGAFEGAYNVYVGHEAGYQNTVGQSNVYIGHAAAKIDTSGRYNVFIGRSAGPKTRDAKFNVFVGAQCAEYKHDGDYNVFVGKGAGAINEDGSGNVFIGNNAGYNSTGELISGFRQLSDNVAIGNKAGHAGIGSENVLIGCEAGCNLTVETSTGNVMIGYQAGYSETGSDKLYIDNSNTLQPLIYGDFSSNYLVINGNNNNGKSFYVNGSAGGSSGWNAKSNDQLKTNIKPIANPLQRVTQLSGINYEWKDKPESGVRMGLLGSEVEKIVPEVITKTENDYFIQYGSLTALLIEAIKDLSAEMEQMKAEQQKQIEALQKRVNELEK